MRCISLLHVDIIIQKSPFRNGLGFAMLLNKVGFFIYLWYNILVISAILLQKEMKWVLFLIEDMMLN